MENPPSEIKAGSIIVLWLTANGYQFSGRVISISENFLVIEDDRKPITRVFSFKSIRRYEVLA